MKMRSVNLLKHTYNAFLSLVTVFYGFSPGVHAQLKIRDQNMVNQQERMVFKSWDREKFTPAPGFLGLNPYYWLTWGLHPNYPKTDLRPLSPSGPETIRLGLSANMQRVDRDYELGSDTLNNVALDQITSYSGLLSNADPLWVLYYRTAFSGLESPVSPLTGVDAKSLAYLQQSGMIGWFNQEIASLKERLELAKNSDLERGSRMILYHRLLLEYRKVKANWEDKKLRSKKYLNNSLQQRKIKDRQIPISTKANSDIEIANRILKNSKL